MSLKMSVPTPTRIETFVIIMSTFASRRSCLILFGLVMVAVLAGTDFFKGMYDICGVKEDSTIYQAVMCNVYVILYITYLHIITVPSALRNLAFLLSWPVFTLLFRLAVFCTFVPVVKISATGISAMIGCLIATMIVLVDFLLIERRKKGTVEVMEDAEDEEILA
ncbi:hypothetical protein PPYR_02612 [Photinus pyralis]|uniref:Uncharacterized protein n=2 Tax=Photinus pyralis TaxID=7054 RepID=A0A5N4B7R2_PHOPY|nr:uncharacterized protein LOC116160415 [Photinus pyralis]KAB0805642.1 hypothetical protein PPYR_02612 [Photinus pyralis]